MVKQKKKKVQKSFIIDEADANCTDEDEEEFDDYTESDIEFINDETSDDNE